MEWKIGEIRQIKGEWYQCINPNIYGCSYCDLQNKCIDDIKGKVAACHSRYRSDKTSVVFKKLEKVGGPFKRNGYFYQEYRTHGNSLLMNGDANIPTPNGFAVIIKQNKEDMEEKKQKMDDLVGLYSSAKITYKKFDKELKALYDKEESEPTLKKFDIEAAKEGKPVCTRDGRKARIICFDAKGDFPIVALVETNNIEEVYQYTNNGLFFHLESNDLEIVNDLMMLPEKKEGWVNVYKNQIHNMLESAEEGHKGRTDYIKTIKVEWEE